MLEAQRRVLDPFLSLATAAATTSTLRLGTAVVLPLERELFTLAKEVATLDQVSAGRLMLGVGVGFRAELEVARPAIAWADRYRLLGDTVGALRRLWSDDEAEYHGISSISNPSGRTQSRCSDPIRRCWPPRPAPRPSAAACRGPTAGCPVTRPFAICRPRWPSSVARPTTSPATRATSI